MKPSISHLFFALLFTISPVNHVYAQTGSNNAVTEHAAIEHGAPISAKNMLEKFKHAMDGTELLNAGFYADDNLNRFFGTPYFFKPLLVPKELNISVISFDSEAPDGQNKHASSGASLFKSGKIYLSNLDSNQVIAHFVIEVNAASTPPDLIDVAMIQSVFGEPTSVNDDKNADLQKKTNSLGNSWLNYQDETGDIFKNILFKTDGDGRINEMQIYIGKKQ